MFGKKKEVIIKAMHYEGIKEFAVNYPVRLQLTDDNFIIQRIKPETTVTLPVSRIQSFNVLGEHDFMQKYHGNADASKGILKYYLVVEYDKGTLAFWGTATEYKHFVDLQFSSPVKQAATIEL